MGNLGGRTLVTPRVPLQPCLGSLVCLQPLQHLQQFDLDRLCREEHGTAPGAGAISTSEFHLHQQSAPRLEIFKLILMAAGQVWARYVGDVGILPVPAALKSFSSDRAGCFVATSQIPTPTNDDQIGTIIRFFRRHFIISSPKFSPRSPSKSGECPGWSSTGPTLWSSWKRWATPMPSPASVRILGSREGLAFDSGNLLHSHIRVYIYFIYIYNIYIYMYIYICIYTYICNTGYIKHWTVELGDHLERTTQTNQPGYMNPGLKQAIFPILHSELRS